MATYIFDYTGGTQSFVVPAGVTSVLIHRMWGAGGAAGTRKPAGLSDASPGSAGGHITGQLVVTPGETLTLLVGGGGQQDNDGTTSAGGYGGGGVGAGGGNQGGGGGGGRSAILRGVTELLTAHGGGGGPSVYTGGRDGGNGTDSVGGVAGSNSGGAAPTDGSALQGGNGGGPDGTGGGGGGGYYGGGGGGGSGAGGGFGGNGGSYTGATGATASPGTGPTPAFYTDALNASTYGGGGVLTGSLGGAGQNGRIVLSIVEGSTQLVMPFPVVMAGDPPRIITVNASGPAATAAALGGGSASATAPQARLSAGGGGGARVAMRIPVVSLTGSVPPPVGGNMAAPTFAATAFGGANSKAAMKKLALSVATTTVEIGHATTRAPASTTAATGLTGGVAKTYVSMPFEVSATGRVSTSAGVYAVMPKASVTASGSRRVASAAATAPRPVLTAIGTAHESANANARMPLASLIGYGGAVLSVSSGRPTVSASAVTGSVGVVTATLPLVVLSSTATQHERGGAVLRMPSLVVGPSGRVAAVMPAGRITSIGHAVVAVTQEAYVLNMNSLQVDGQDVVMGGQLTRYTDFPFTKVVRYLGSYYGVASDGLYLLEGDTNNGAPIEWAFTTCTTDFKAPMKKTVASVYFGGELGPEAEFMVACGELPDQMHQYTTTKQALQRNHRQKFGLGRKARYYAFGVAGDGELNLDSLEFEVANMTRRI